MLFVLRVILIGLRRFKLSIDVYDGSDAAVFMLFDNDVQMLAKKSCVELVSNIKVVLFYLQFFI